MLNINQMTVASFYLVTDLEGSCGYGLSQPDVQFNGMGNHGMGNWRVNFTIDGVGMAMTMCGPVNAKHNKHCISRWR